jgi:hypothetical protein
MPAGVVAVTRQYMPVCSLVISTLSPGRMGPEGSVELVKVKSCVRLVLFWAGPE